MRDAGGDQVWKAMPHLKGGPITVCRASNIIVLELPYTPNDTMHAPKLYALKLRCKCWVKID